jgi:hypothetical protein
VPRVLAFQGGGCQSAPGLVGLVVLALWFRRRTSMP